MPYPYASKPTPAPKSMGTYQMFALSDALALADLLRRTYDAAHVRRLYAAQPVETLVGIEEDCQAEIASLIQRSESQRPALLARLAKEHPQGKDFAAIVLVLAIVGQKRVHRTIELRDRFRMALQAGGGNRVTCAALWTFATELAGSIRYDYPDDVFDTLSADDAFDQEILRPGSPRPA